MRLVSSPLANGFGLVGDRRLDESARPAYDIINPATGNLLARVPMADDADAQAAVDAARQAFPSWRSLTARHRADILERWQGLIRQNADDIAHLIVQEQGKPLPEAQSEVDYAASYVKFYAEEATRLHGEVIPSAVSTRRQIVTREPVGVCAAITPWNFPAAMVTRKLAPALAAGCTVVLKPSELTPLTALKLVELALQAGVPAGVLNVVVGPAAAIGAVLTGSPAVRMLSFTGSTRVGQLIMAQCASTIKKLGLELGGNAPFIVFDDAYLDEAVEGALASKYRNAGQTCICANRFYVQSGIYAEFADRIVQRVRAMKVGNGLEPGVQLGPLINAAAVRKALSHIEDAVNGGAHIATGGRPIDGPGHFLEPTVLLNVQPHMLCMREETFGPVAPLVRFNTEDEVIRLANAGDAGLASYFYSRDIARCFRVAEAIEAGMVGVNTGLISSEVVPFGGIKQSGLGREGSRHGLEEYTDLKLTCFGGIRPATSKGAA